MCRPASRGGVWRVIVLPLAFVATAGAAVRADDDSVSEVRSRGALERKAEAARQAAQELDLTCWQARRLLPIVEAAAALHAEAFEEEARLLPDLIEALSDFCREDALNEGFSPEVEQRTARLNQQAKELRERTTAELIELEEQAADVLTRSQRERAGLDEAGQRRSSDRSSHRPGDDLAAARQELRELHEEKHPQLGPLGQHLLHPAAGEVLADMAGTRTPETIQRALAVLECGTEDHPLRLVESQRTEVERWRQEINNWNLINGLHLSGGQIEAIVRLYEAPPLKEGDQTLRGEAAVVALERSVERVLNPGQRQVLAGFKPCLIPPKNLKDPVRIGQATDSAPADRWLARARQVSGDQLEELIDRAIEKENEHWGRLDPTEEWARRILLRNTARRSAKMSDVDFELNRAELAELITRPDPRDELRSRVDSLSRSRGRPGVVARFMLNDGFIRQLRERGRQLAAGVQPALAAPAEGPRAERVFEHRSGNAEPRP